jgi:DNA-directed RNA polymerase sigma subunit (sigma70/sigma32)
MVLLHHSSMRDDVDSWGTFEKSIEGYPVLEADEQLSTWRRYDANRGTPAGDLAFTTLCGANWRLAKSVVTATLKRRNTAVSGDTFSDLASEANVGLCEAIAAYDPLKGGTLSNYVATCVERRLSGALNGSLPANWSKVRRIAVACEARLTATTGRVPSERELIGEVQAYCMEWAKKRLLEAGSSADEAACKAKLVRQGVWAATLRVVEIRDKAYTLSLDRPSEDGSTLSDTVASDERESDDGGVISWLLGALGLVDRELVTRRYGLNGVRESKYEDLAGELGVEWPIVRNRVNCAMGRMYAPHAHYASLAQDLDGQVSDEDETTSGSGRFKARRAGIMARSYHSAIDVG